MHLVGANGNGTHFDEDTVNVKDDVVMSLRDGLGGAGTKVVPMSVKACCFSCP